MFLARGGLAADSFAVIVVGGDAEGVAAAVGAARAGARTLLLDTRPVLGGLLTRGWLNSLDMNLDPQKRPLNDGLFGEVFRQLDGTSFDVGSMGAILRRLVDGEPNLQVEVGLGTILPVVGSAACPLVQPGLTLFPDDSGIPLESIGTPAYPLPAVAGPGVTLIGSHATTLWGVEVIDRAGKTRRIAGQRLIDATQDADLAVAAGAAWHRYGTDVWGHPRNMAVTLVFRLDGLSETDWGQLQAALRTGGSDGLTGADSRSAWGFGPILKEYQPISDRLRVRGPNIGRQNDGSLLLNALHVFGCDGLERESRREARRLAEAELPALTAFLRRRIPGLSQVRLAGTAPELYVRTARNIQAVYTLTVDDVLENRDFPDRLAFGSYPLDVQATGPDAPGDVIGKPEQYAVPLRSLLPRGFGNLLVVGRSAGFDSLAQSSVRTIPVGMATGQGAGVTAAVSIRRSAPLASIASDPALMAEVHRLMRAQGIRVDPNPAVAPPETRHWAYAALQYYRRLGQVSGGYQNAYPLDRLMPPQAFLNRLKGLRPPPWGQGPEGLVSHRSFVGPPTLGAACRLLSRLEGLGKTDAEAFSLLRDRGLFSAPWPEAQARADVPLTYGAGFLLLCRWGGVLP